MDRKKLLISLWLLALSFHFCQTTTNRDSTTIQKVSLIVVNKSARTLSLVAGNQVLRTYRVSLGEDPVSPKEQEGDKRTPEGLYKIISKSETSSYYKNLGISYPSASDLERAKLARVNPGSDIKIHGLKNGYGFWGRMHRWIDWTNGCIAVTNAEMDEIYELVPLQTPIRIEK